MTCINDSIALSFATATVIPGGEKLAWLTQLATIALCLKVESEPSLAVTTYRPPLNLPKALSKFESRFLIDAIFFFLLISWPKSVPASSNLW